MTTRYDLIVARLGREDKVYWTKIGSAFPAKTGGGFSLIFDALPLPDKEGICRVLMREPQERNTAYSSPSKSAAPSRSSDGFTPADPIDRPARQGPMNEIIRDDIPFMWM